MYGSPTPTRWCLVVALLTVIAVPLLAGTGLASATTDAEQRVDAGQEQQASVLANEGNESSENETAVDPTASFDAPSSIEAGTSATFDASSSDPGDDEIAGYVWRVDEGDGEHMEITSSPTYEYTFEEPGSTEVHLEVITDDDRRDETTETVRVAVPTVEGTVVHAGDEVGDHDVVQLLDGDEEVATTETGDDGSFTLSPDDPGTYDLVYVDERVLEGDELVRNDLVDFYAIESVTIEDAETPVDVGTVTLPESNRLHWYVRDSESETGIENATVTYTHSNGGATVSHTTTTGPDGNAGLIGIGDEIEVETHGPEGYHDVESPERVDLDRNERKTVYLDGAITGSFDVDPEPVPIGENASVTLEAETGTAESITWFVDGAQVATDNQSIEVSATDPDPIDVSASLEGENDGTTTVTRSIPVDTLDRELRLEVPDRTNTHEPFAATAIHEVEQRNVSVESYNWQLHDESGERLEITRSSSPTTEFAVESLGDYTVSVVVRDEFDVTKSTNATIEADAIPSWAESGASHVEIGDVEMPLSLEGGSTTSIDVTATNTGDVPDLVDVTAENETSTVDRTTLELGSNETGSVTLEYTPPNRPGNYTLTVSTAHDRVQESYTVTASSNETDDGQAANATDGDPQELDLLPTPSVGADISAVSVSRDRLGSVVLGTATTTVLGGFGLLGYVVYTRPKESGVDWLASKREPPKADESQ
ncbi:PKD domain-containing protein [Natronobacterium texcoconense]|uniref:PKD domain-containing protein n=1 Tax=Natronobacterium texcoconense TaxID=1095778 RepID=A0A1H1HNN0_NATTX|nr:PKD domain-containing protein [Natronobacterium texcoconense]SDR27060.1 PKD domain-containing protein [Natronobacterium texcoconense]